MRRSALRSDLPARRRARTGLLPALLLAVVAGGAARAGDVAVVVHPSVKVDDVTFAELKKILLGDRQFWTKGEQVLLIVRAPIAEERTVLLEKVYEMSEAQFKQYWVGKVFRAEASSGPKVVISNEKAVELVAVLPGAIALVNVDDVPEGLKILKVDGKKPGDEGYPLCCSSAEPSSTGDPAPRAGSGGR